MRWILTPMIIRGIESFVLGFFTTLPFVFKSKNVREFHTVVTKVQRQLMSRECPKYYWLFVLLLHPRRVTPHKHAQVSDAHLENRLYSCLISALQELTRHMRVHRRASVGFARLQFSAKWARTATWYLQTVAAIVRENNTWHLVARYLSKVQPKVCKNVKVSIRSTAVVSQTRLILRILIWTRDTASSWQPSGNLWDRLSMRLHWLIYGALCINTDLQVSSGRNIRWLQQKSNGTRSARIILYKPWRAIDHSELRSTSIWCLSWRNLGSERASMSLQTLCGTK